MSKIIAANDDDGSVTFEIDYGGGVLQEQLSVSDYPTAAEILAHISEREKQVTDEVAANKSADVIPQAIKDLIGK